MFLGNAWYQAGWSHESSREAQLSRRWLDEPLVLFWDRAGVPHALDDP